MMINRSTGNADLAEMLDELEVEYTTRPDGVLDLGYCKIGIPAEEPDLVQVSTEHFRPLDQDGQMRLPLAPDSKELAGVWEVHSTAGGDRFLYSSQMSRAADYDELLDALHDLVDAQDAINSLEIGEVEEIRQ